MPPYHIATLAPKMVSGNLEVLLGAWRQKRKIPTDNAAHNSSALQTEKPGHASP